MYNKEEDLEEDYMEGEKRRSYGRQELRTSEDDIQIGRISIGELKLN